MWRDAAVTGPPGRQTTAGFDSRGHPISHERAPQVPNAVIMRGVWGFPSLRAPCLIGASAEATVQAVRSLLRRALRNSAPEA